METTVVEEISIDDQASCSNDGAIYIITDDNMLLEGMKENPEPNTKSEENSTVEESYIEEYSKDIEKKCFDNGNFGKVLYQYGSSVYECQIDCCTTRKTGRKFQLIHCIGHKDMTECEHASLPKPGDQFDSLDVFDDYILKNAKTWKFYFYRRSSHYDRGSFDYTCYNRTLCPSKSLDLRNNVSKKTVCPCVVQLKKLSQSETVTVTFSCCHHDHPLNDEYFMMMQQGKRFPENLKKEIQYFKLHGMTYDVLQAYVYDKTGFRMPIRYFAEMKNKAMKMGLDWNLPDEKRNELDAKMNEINAKYIYLGNKEVRAVVKHGPRVKRKLLTPKEKKNKKPEGKKKKTANLKRECIGANNSSDDNKRSRLEFSTELVPQIDESADWTRNELKLESNETQVTYVIADQTDGSINTTQEMYDDNIEQGIPISIIERDNNETYVQVIGENNEYYYIKNDMLNNEVHLEDINHEVDNEETVVEYTQIDNSEIVETYVDDTEQSQAVDQIVEVQNDHYNTIEEYATEVIESENTNITELKTESNVDDYNMDHQNKLAEGKPVRIYVNKFNISKYMVKEYFRKYLKDLCEQSGNISVLDLLALMYKGKVCVLIETNLNKVSLIENVPTVEDESNITEIENCRRQSSKYFNMMVKYKELLFSNHNKHKDEIAKSSYVTNIVTSYESQMQDLNNSLSSRISEVEKLHAEENQYNVQLESDLNEALIELKKKTEEFKAQYKTIGNLTKENQMIKSENTKLKRDIDELKKGKPVQGITIKKNKSERTPDKSFVKYMVNKKNNKSIPIVINSEPKASHYKIINITKGRKSIVVDTKHTEEEKKGEPEESPNNEELVEYLDDLDEEERFHVTNKCRNSSTFTIDSKNLENLTPQFIRISHGKNISSDR